jgi:glycosyltransferase involved in cell wall biosynthesis
MSQKISVVIPCKDRAELLDRALASVSEQTLLPREVIVVDDGSEPPLSLRQSYSVPVKLIRQRNQGPAAARTRSTNLPGFASPTWRCTVGRPWNFRSRLLRAVMMV